MNITQKKLVGVLENTKGHKFIQLWMETIVKNNKKSRSFVKHTDNKNALLYVLNSSNKKIGKKMTEKVEEIRAKNYSDEELKRLIEIEDAALNVMPATFVEDFGEVSIIKLTEVNCSIGTTDTNKINNARQAEGVEEKFKTKDDRAVFKKKINKYVSQNIKNGTYYLEAFQVHGKIPKVKYFIDNLGMRSELDGKRLEHFLKEYGPVERKSQAEYQKISEEHEVKPFNPSFNFI